MANTHALHQINSGIQDVLSGYETLKERAEPAIMGIAQDLDALHRRHASEIQSRLTAHGEGTDDASIRGTVNKIATTMRDWVGSLDENALSFVRQGEEMLLGVYDAALNAWEEVDDEDKRVVTAQADELRTKIAALPQS